MDKQYAKEKRKICPSIIEFIENHDSQFFNQGREILVREKPRNANRASAFEQSIISLA